MNKQTLINHMVSTLRVNNQPNVDSGFVTEKEIEDTLARLEVIYDGMTLEELMEVFTERF